MTITYQSAVIFVQDMQTSRAFYEGLLDQQVEMDFGANVGYVGGLALWEAQHALQMIYDETRSPASPLGQHNLELYFETEDLDAAWARLEAAQVTVVHPIKTQPWAQRALRVCDPDGHIIEIAEPMPVVIQRLLGEGLSEEQVSERTSMPLPIVQQIAAART
ncbi:MAG: glyoxalase [Chloroflexi bacterium]|nr:glyoxalase [Chloroflexota bacterium]